MRFFALSKVNDSKPPGNIRDRTRLTNAGLGEASIQFALDMNSVQCHQIILERYPKLQETGYDILLFQRGGEDSGFIKIEGPYTPRRLKDASGSSKIYLKPLQKDLDVETVLSNESEVSE